MKNIKKKEKKKKLFNKANIANRVRKVSSNDYFSLNGSSVLTTKLGLSKRQLFYYNWMDVKSSN